MVLLPTQLQYFLISLYEKLSIIYTISIEEQLVLGIEDFSKNLQRMRFEISKLIAVSDGTDSVILKIFQESCPLRLY